MSNSAIFQDHAQLFVQQRKEWTEIMLDWETKNQYTILDVHKNELGTVVEKSGGIAGFFSRTLLRSHRPFEIGIFDRNGRLELKLLRPFFFLFSSLQIQGPTGRSLGHVERRFGLLYRKYDLYDDAESLFARIEGPIWRIWTFPVLAIRGTGEASISKRWGGGLREIFTDADTFMIDFKHDPWTEPQRSVIFSAAISIDFDFFENNQANDGIL